MQSTNKVIKMVDKRSYHIIFVSLLILFINSYNNNKTLMIDISNTCLFATIFSVICIKIFIFNSNLKIIKNNIEVTDTLVWAFNLINAKLIIGIMFSGLNAMIPLFRIEFIFFNSTVLTFMFCLIKELSHIYFNNDNYITLRSMSAFKKEKIKTD